MSANDSLADGRLKVLAAKVNAAEAATAGAWRRLQPAQVAPSPNLDHLDYWQCRARFVCQRFDSC